MAVDLPFLWWQTRIDDAFFGELVGEFTATKLQKTFQYIDSIAEIAGRFVMENPEQYKKQIDTHTKVDRSQVHLPDDSTGGQDGV